MVVQVVEGSDPRGVRDAEDIDVVSRIDEDIGAELRRT
jgi:hypothetical protein